MKLIKEIASMSPAAVRLTDTQKLVLVSIFSAPTAETAYDTTTGSQNFIQARQQLRSLGLITVDETASRAGVSDVGQEVLSNNNLIDDMGQLTDEGSALIDTIDSSKKEFTMATEARTFDILKQLI